jgi:hypothetical protein
MTRSRSSFSVRIASARLRESSMKADSSSPKPELVHEQSWLDQRQDFSDAKVVSGMRKTHGKFRGEKRARRMEDSGREETESCEFSEQGGLVVMLPPLVPKIQAPSQFDGMRVRTGRRHGRPVVGCHA